MLNVDCPQLLIVCCESLDVNNGVPVVCTCVCMAAAGDCSDRRRAYTRTRRPRYVWDGNINRQVDSVQCLWRCSTVQLPAYHTGCWHQQRGI